MVLEVSLTRSVEEPGTGTDNGTMDVGDFFATGDHEVRVICRLLEPG